MAGRSDGSHRRQTLPFTCGAAALGSALAALGWRGSRNRLDDELAIWRESTAIACPGAHPFGLALSARRRGFSVQVVGTGRRPWLGNHVRTVHSFSNRRLYARIERGLEQECRKVGISIRWPDHPTEQNGVGLLLVPEGGETPGEHVPHWIAVRGTAGGVYVDDPLRASGYRSNLSILDWWGRSGFETTRTWIAIQLSKKRGR